MKIVMTVLCFALCNYVYADVQTPCQKKISKVVTAAAKASGVSEKFAFEVAEPVAVGKDLEGGNLQSYSTSPFFIADGYISSSGAIVTVREKSCEIIKLEMTLGQ